MADLSLYASIKALRQQVALSCTVWCGKRNCRHRQLLHATADAEARAKQMHDMAEAATRTACLHDQSADCGDADCPQHRA